MPRAIGLGVGVNFGGAPVVAAAFSPLDLSPALWLDASDTSTITESGGSVSQWNDKSGAARHVTQATGASQPATGTRTQNGLNVIDFVRGRFLDAGDVMDLGTSAWSSFAVVKFDDTASSAPYGKHIAGATDGRYGLLRDAGSLTAIYDSDSTATGTVSVADTSTSTRRLSTVLTRAGAASSHVLRVSGVATTTTFSDPGTSWDTNAPWRVGRYGTSTAADFDGFIAELVVLLRTATNDEVASMESYLTTKWGL